jgi:hypothetical protein
MRWLLWLAVGLGAIVLFFAWANWYTRRRHLRTTKQQFVNAIEQFFAGTLEVDDWELFLAHPMGDSGLEALRSRLQGFTWEKGEGRDEMRAALSTLRASLASLPAMTNFQAGVVELLRTAGESVNIELAFTPAGHHVCSRFKVRGREAVLLVGEGELILELDGEHYFESPTNLDHERVREFVKFVRLCLGGTPPREARLAAQANAKFAS